MTYKTTSAHCAMALAALLIAVAATDAFESYHDPSLNDQGYCSDCHPGFTGGTSDTLHRLHVTGGNPFTTNCNLCHTGAGRNNPLTVWSSGNNLGCAGCHGRDYGETTAANYGGRPSAGKPKATARGLRRHHDNSGITVCAGCHSDGEPFPENAPFPPYYLRTDTSLVGLPLAPCSNEDSPDDASTFGLDNDGDLLYDNDDDDCDSHIIAFHDLALLLAQWAASSCGPDNVFCSGADLDFSSNVDFTDLEILALFWLTDSPEDWLLR